ncbi:hypothetical protein P691DRAFT_783132 [Macrolepiota fuliginosa MF-IS2]|uniref:Uncharacterized protein n=1 Tax=Macrolepiota fuliginosa MF-IS2 TaxID=1400762 RepID=A0A9P6C2W7_9AGAR|nr:hypothetical protein P691DRAFT_783132 [Macrolepiota fuliginosa MF-IS2]
MQPKKAVEEQGSGRFEETMGRALFSQNYTSAPVVREEPDPAAIVLDIPCERWSTWNHFDPDSEEFFKDAQLEHFVDGPIDSPIEVDNGDEPHVVILESVSDSSSSSSSTSSNDNDDVLSGDDNNDALSDTNNSPMAVGADDPATLLAGAYTPVDWQQRFLEAGSDPRRQGRPTRLAHRAPRRIGATRQYTNPGDSNSPITLLRPVSVFIPPASYRTTSTPNPGSAAMTAQEAPIVLPPQHATGAPRSPVSRRTVSITPINIPSEPSLPSPVSPSTPSTPIPTNIIYPASNGFTSPSPAPNVTPRIYSWNRAPHAPGSPTRDSPLTNPRARLSLSRIDTMSMAMAQRQYNAPVPVLDRRYQRA